MLTLNEIREYVASRMTQKRMTHTLGVEKLAAHLANIYGVDEETARRAALWHDVTKQESVENQLILVRQYGIITDYDDDNFPALIHADTGAAVARWRFAETDRVARAVALHTTGGPGMDLLEKIIYISDVAEENRTYPGASELRLRTETDLDGSVAFALQFTVDSMAAKGKTAYHRTADALRLLRKEE